MPYIPRHLSYTDADGDARVADEQELLAFEGPAVILAEPGMGKTELLKALAEASDRLEYVSARGLLRRSVSTFKPGRKLVIDGLDELSAAREHDPVQDVLGQLCLLGSPPFILSCRAADWRSIAGQDILEDYGAKPREFRLEPLTEPEAQAFLADRHGPDRSRALLVDLKSRGLADFFGNPLTLQLIDRLASGEGRLPSSRADLYLKAADLLRQEQNHGHGRSPLASLSSAEALDAAGAACAALILTGSEAIALGVTTGQDDLLVAEIPALPGAAAAATVVKSNLFQRRDGGDRVGPFHRALAECLGARWLASQVGRMSGRRLLALLTVEGGVPASLRGLHAWLAHFSAELAPAVMAADPYGVLRYGDAAHLAPAAARSLLGGLEALASEDPYFRSEDWGSHSAPGLTQADLAPDLRRILFEPGGNFHLKSLVLGALPKSEAGRILDADLEQIFMGADAERFTFHERSAALEVLVEQRPRHVWSDTFETLLRRPGEDDRRLVVEGMATVGCRWFKSAQIARAALAYLGLLPGAGTAQAHVDTIGPLHFLAAAVEDDQTHFVLDALVTLSPAARRLDWRRRLALNDLVSTLASRALDAGAVAPLRTLGWLRLMRSRTTDYQDTDAHRRLNALLISEAEMRWAIQSHLLFRETASADLRDRIWRMGQDHSALRLTDADAAHHLRSDLFAVPGDPAAVELWRALTAYAVTFRGLSPMLREAAEPFAHGFPELEVHLAALSVPKIPKWRREQAAARAFRKGRRRRQFARERQRFLDHEAEIRVGDWFWLHRLGEAWLNRYSDLDRDASPRDRIRAWVGPEVLAAILEGFEALVRRDDLPSPEAVAQSYAEGRYWKVMRPLLAAGCERVITGGGLEDLSDSVGILLALGVHHDHVEEASGGKALAGALDLWLGQRPAVHERYVRLLIEPQLASKSEHVSGLHSLLAGPDPEGRITPLLVEWLDRFPNMAETVASVMTSALAEKGQWTTLLERYYARGRRGFKDEADRLSWLAIAYVADFDGERDALDAAAASHPDLFWYIRLRGWPRGGDAAVAGVSVASMAWFIRSFRLAFPMVYRPTGSSMGDTNPWDAADTLRGVIRRLATNTSDEAAEALTALRDEVDDGYREILQNACAQQLKARRDAAFTGPGLGQVAAVLTEQGPQSVADLQAIVLDALGTIQARMGRDDVDQVALFHSAEGPKSEEACRNALVILLRDRIGYGIEIIPERLMPHARRADMVAAAGDLRLPIEAKGQWHRELWVAANAQLDARYAIEWRSSGLGIYLVFWFGPDVPPSKRLKSSGRGVTPPDSAEALRSALTHQIPEHRRGSIVVFVLDACAGVRTSPA